MMPKTLSPTIPDPFEVFHSVHKDKRLWQGLAVALFAILVFVVGVLVVVSSRPPVVIVMEDAVGVAPRIIQNPETPLATEAHAKVFFLNMLKLRYGWDSLTVERDMGSYRDQCHVDQGVFERDYQDEMVTTDEDADVESMPRKLHWVRSQIRNTVILPESLDDVQCKWDAEQAWNCFVRASVVTQRLFPPYISAPPQRRSVFIASLLPVKHTITTPYGLIVGVLRELPDDTKGSH